MGQQRPFGRQRRQLLLTLNQETPSSPTQRTMRPEMFSE